MTMPSHDMFYTTDEVAERLGVSRRTVHVLIHKGRLPALFIGRTYRIKKVDFDTLLRDTSTKKPTSRPRPHPS